MDLFLSIWSAWTCVLGDRVYAFQLPSVRLMKCLPWSFVSLVYFAVSAIIEPVASVEMILETVSHYRRRRFGFPQLWQSGIIDHSPLLAGNLRRSIAEAATLTNGQNYRSAFRLASGQIWTSDRQIAGPFSRAQRLAASSTTPRCQSLAKAS